MKSNWKSAAFSTGLMLSLAGCNGQQSNSQTGQTKANVTVPQPPAGDADAQSSAYLAAAEPFENLTEQAATATPANLATLIADATKAADGITLGLGATHKAALDTHISDIESAQKADDRTAIALAAVEGYRTLVESASDTGKVPRAVSLLDYSGFRYQADLTAKPIMWDDAGQAVGFAQQQWSSIADRVTDVALKSDFAKSVADMDSAVKAKDAQAATTASTHELDLVDKLESFFSKP